jgi:two-component system response regulator AtoC
LDILVVDDEPMIREFLSDLLTLRGHRPRTADSSVTAMRELQQQPCDLVITDVFMPSTSGLDMAANIRANYPDTRILVMSGHSHGPDRKDARWSAVDGFIGKPFSNQELTRMIEEVTCRV